MPQAIAEETHVSLGGTRQWSLIRGEDIANPALIILHGGPGMPETPLLQHFNGVLEKTFTVVYWEQRAAGRSFSSDIPASSMTVARFVQDLDELVDHVRSRLGKDKVVILGHSWGSALGTLYAAQHPEKVAHYAGVGQIGNLQASEEASYAFVLDEARRRGNTRAEKALTRLGPPPYTDRQLMVQRQWLSRFAGTFGSLPFFAALRILILAPGGSIFDVPKVFRGMMFSLRNMWAELAKLNLETAVPELKMPVTFLLGRLDHQVDAQVAAAYFEKLIAPRKRLVWFEHSGHFAPFEEPEAFNRAMIEIADGLER
jgi:pimeloyl-ACP methyl ester carboxylesterase